MRHADVPLIPIVDNRNRVHCVDPQRDVLHAIHGSASHEHRLLIVAKHARRGMPTV